MGYPEETIMKQLRVIPGRFHSPADLMATTRVFVPILNRY